ncbi:MAG TPA: GNAT family N-acetyltransferase [Candidatus Acidoferrum sp.]|jgi:ribosomal protein S18 acetylase RimI-like enzyme
MPNQHASVPGRPADSVKSYAETGRIFREYVESDYGPVSKILHESNLSLHLPDGLSCTTSPDAGATQIHLCELHQEPIAVLQWRNLGEEAEILNLAVPPRRRRQGHARFLLTNFLMLARELRLRDISLEVRESNTAAIALYRTIGFIQSGRRPGYYRDPVEAAFLFQRELTD